MSGQKVVDVVVGHGRVQIVQSVALVAPERAPAGFGGKSLAAITTPWTVLLGSGAACVGLGVLTLGLFPYSVMGLVLTNLLFSAGAGLGVLALAKRASGPKQESAPALPAAVDPKLMAERGRRVRAALDGVGPQTFERLLAELKWTADALVSTLVEMKERGVVVEDLSLDTGEWVYSLAEDDTLVGSPTLGERQAQEGEPEGQG